MTRDLEIIKQLEKEIGVKLEKRDFDEIIIFYKKDFAVDEKGAVTGLKLDHIKLNSIPRTLTGLNSLKKLSLSSNEIVDLSPLAGLSNLTIIYLSGNQIVDLSPLAGLSGLTILNLINNQIVDLSPLLGLSCLKHLDIRNNRINTLPEAVLEMGLDIDVELMYEEEMLFEYIRFEGILLHGNPLESPPVEIIKKGREAMRAYFRSLKKEENLPLNELKVLLVGDGGAGKTYNKFAQWLALPQVPEVLLGKK